MSVKTRTAYLKPTFAKFRETGEKTVFPEALFLPEEPKQPSSKANKLPKAGVKGEKKINYFQNIRYLDERAGKVQGSSDTCSGKGERMRGGRGGKGKLQQLGRRMSMSI